MPPCEGKRHQMQQFTCMSENCGERRRICRNKGCGYVSSRNMDVWFCKLCRIAEKNAEVGTQMSQQEIEDRPQLRLEASVTYNKENNRFNVHENFFKYIPDYEEKKIRDMMQQKVKPEAPSDPSGDLEFEPEEDKAGERDTIRPPIQPQDQVNDGVSNFNAVRKLDERQFELVHKTDPQ